MQILLNGRAMYVPYPGGALFYLNPIFLEDIERDDDEGTNPDYYEADMWKRLAYSMPSSSINSKP